MFRLKVIDNKNTVIGLADSIKTFQEPGESGGGSKDTDTLLILREKNIQLPFKIEMEKDQKPVLVLQEKIRLKQLFKHNIQIKVLIYTAAIRDILKTYLSDTEFKDCEYKTKFIEKIQQICGGDLNDPPPSKDDSKKEIYANKVRDVILNRFSALDIQQSSDFLVYDKMALEILDGKSILSYISNSRNVGVSVFVSTIYSDRHQEHYFIFFII